MARDKYGWRREGVQHSRRLEIRMGELGDRRGRVGRRVRTGRRWSGKSCVVEEVLGGESGGNWICRD